MVLSMFFEALYFGHFLSFYTLQLEPPKINEKNSAKEEIAEALEAARNIIRLYNEMAQTADNRAEAIQKPSSTGNVSPFSF